MSRLKVDNIEARSGNNIAFEDPMQLKSESTLNINDEDMPNFYANVSLTRERFLATKLQESDTAGLSE